MSKLVCRLSPLISLMVLVFGPPAPPSAGSAENSRPPRIRPLSEHAIEVAPWEYSSASPLGGFRIGGTEQRRFAFSPDGALLVSEDAGGWQLEFWSVAAKKSLGRFGRIENPVAIAFSPDGKTLVAAHYGNGLSPVDLWDVAAHKAVRNLDEGVNDVPFTAAAFSPDGKILAFGGGVSRRTRIPAIYLWDAATGYEVRKIEGVPFSADPRRSWQTSVIDGLCYSPDGRSLAFVDDGKVWLWEVATGKERRLLGMVPLAGRLHGNAAAGASLSFSPNGRTLAVGCADGAVHLWDIVGGGERPPFVGHKGGVSAVRFAPDGKTLWSFGRDNKVRTWPVSGLFSEWRPESGKPSDKMLAGWWDDLLSDDPLIQYGAGQNLAASPAATARFLRNRLKPVPLIDERYAVQLVADLKKPDFNDRKKAVIELRKLGELAVPILRRGNARGGYDEICMRLLQKMEAQYPTPKQLQAWRALEALERAGGSDATQLLFDLSKGAPEALLSRQAKASLERLQKTPALLGENVAPEKLWDELASDDAELAYQAVQALARRPNKAILFLHDRLQARAAEQTSDDPKRVAKLIADLGDDDFNTREAAFRELGRLGRSVEPALAKALQEKPEAERRRRLEELMKVKRPELSSKQLQEDRALEVLELIAGAEVRQALESLKKDARNHWLKERIGESLHRLHQ